VTAPPLPDVPGVLHRYVTVRGVRLHVAEAGRGAPLILLHGWPQHWWCWRHLIGRFAERHRVLVPDLRGWGWSDAPPGRYAKRDYAEDVRALMDAEGIERADIVAHDWGGYAAFLLALEHPGRLRRLVALDIPPPFAPTPGPRLALVPLLLSYQAVVAAPLLGPWTMTSSRRFVRMIIRTGSGANMHWTEPELDAYAAVLRDPARARASSRCYRTFLTRELWPAARGRYRRQELEVPTLLLAGGASFLWRGFTRRPGGNLEIATIPGAGHFLPEEAPDAVFTHADAFLTASGSPPEASGT
jgi:pimeloyl-ACP methyl ester carboxylesterase